LKISGSVADDFENRSHRELAIPKKFASAAEDKKNIPVSRFEDFGKSADPLLRIFKK
jgi:hypothetical protein